jgi:hypothetical protein
MALRPIYTGAKPLTTAKNSVRVMMAAIQRVVVKCKAGQDEDEGREQIMASVSANDSVKIIHKLKRANSYYAISIKSSSHLGEMNDALGLERYDDPMRRPLYSQESIQVHDRKLQAGQYKFFGSDIVAAAEACRDAGANIISIYELLGGPRFDEDEKEIFEDFFDQGILSIAAAGNMGDTEPHYPASLDNVMSVAAVDSNGSHTSFSTRNNQVDIAGPGTT